MWSFYWNFFVAYMMSGLLQWGKKFLSNSSLILARFGLFLARLSITSLSEASPDYENIWRATCPSSNRAWAELEPNQNCDEPNPSLPGFGLFATLWTGQGMERPEGWQFISCRGVRVVVISMVAVVVVLRVVVMMKVVADIRLLLENWCPSLSLSMTSQARLSSWRMNPWPVPLL